MKIILIVFYFGKFPNHFPLFLESCKKNPKITWRIYTDNEKTSDWPVNVEHMRISFLECQELFQKKFLFPISLEQSRKFCDYKVSYGYVLEETLREYTHWGYCDVDLIWGDLQGFLEKETWGNYDKLFDLGHLTIYKNEFSVNRQFMNLVHGKPRYQEVFQTSKICGFDEWGSANINEIFKASPCSYLQKAIGADVWPERTAFDLSGYVPLSNRYASENRGVCVFEVKDGQVICYWKKDGVFHQEEFPYVHMQKREFAVNMDEKEHYFIVPNKFLPGSIGVEKALQIGSRKVLFDKQWFKIKVRNLRNRLHL